MVLVEEYESRWSALQDSKERKGAWRSIADSVSAVEGIPRTVEQCRKKIKTLRSNTPGAKCLIPGKEPETSSEFDTFPCVF
jgi:hypothetical protein